MHSLDNFHAFLPFFFLAESSMHQRKLWIINLLIHCQTFFYPRLIKEKVKFRTQWLKRRLHNILVDINKTTRVYSFYQLFWHMILAYLVGTQDIYSAEHENENQRHRWKENHIGGNDKPVLCTININLCRYTKNCDSWQERCDQRRRNRYRHQPAVREEKFLRCSQLSFG